MAPTPYVVADTGVGYTQVFGYLSLGEAVTVQGEYLSVPLLRYCWTVAHHSKGTSSGSAVPHCPSIHLYRASA